MEAFENYTFGKHLISPEQRQRLQEAILNDDPDSFRQIRREDPPPPGLRLYGVLTQVEEQMILILVDQNGERFGGPGAVIPEGTPIEMLNIEYFPERVVATIGDEDFIASTPIKGLTPDSSRD